MSKPFINRPGLLSNFFKLFFILLFVVISSIEGLGQEVVTLTYDLDKGEFLEKNRRFTYKGLNTIHGLFQFEGKVVDAIQLRIVKKLNKEEIKELEVKRNSIIPINNQLVTYRNKLTFLNTIKSLSEDGKNGNNTVIAILKGKIQETSNYGFSSLVTLLNAAALDFDNLLTTTQIEIGKLNDQTNKAQEDISNTIKEIEILLEENQVFHELRKNESLDNRFSFSVGDLEMNEEYEFQFHWYTANTSTAPIDKLKDRTDSLIEALLSKEDKVLKSEVRTLLSPYFEKLNGEIFKNVFELSEDNSLISNKKVQLNDSVTNRFIDLYFNLSQAKWTFKDRESKLRDFQKDLFEKVTLGATFKNTLTPASFDSLNSLVSGQLDFNRDAFQRTLARFSQQVLPSLVTKYNSWETAIGNLRADALRTSVDAALNALSPPQSLNSLSQADRQAYDNFQGVGNYDSLNFRNWLGIVGVPDNAKLTTLGLYKERYIYESEVPGFWKTILATPVETISLSSLQREKFKDLIDSVLNYDPSEFNTLIDAIGYQLDNQLKADYLYIKQVRDYGITAEEELAAAEEKLERMFDFVRNSYVSDGNSTSLASTSSSGSTGLDGIRLSTTYGLAAIPLKNDFGIMEWSQYIGVNIRFADFDNELTGKDVFKHSVLSRFSALIGFLVTDELQFNGQKLENTRLGFKPIIGLNYQPLKHLTIGAGIVSFIPESINNGPTKTIVKPFVSLSFDFNLFNYLIQKK